MLGKLRKELVMKLFKLGVSLPYRPRSNRSMNLYAVDNMRFRFLSMFCVSDVDGLNVFRHDLNRRVFSLILRRIWMVMMIMLREG